LPQLQSKQEKILTKQYPLTARDVNDYAYCPRIPYWLKVRKIRQPKSIKMRYGEQYHAKYLRRAKPSSETLVNIYMKHKMLNISTIIDLIELNENNLIYLHEVKFTKLPPKIPINHYLQLIAQSVVIENNFEGKKVSKAFITYPSNNYIEIPLPISKEKIIRPILKSIREIIHLEILYPPTSNYNKCLDCEFYKYCRRA